MVALLRHFDGAKNFEMFSHKLRVEQVVAAGLKTGNEMDERNLGSIAGTMKHALAKECTAKRNAIQAANECITIINFNAVAMALIIQRAIHATNTIVNPRVRATGLRLRACSNDGVEIAINPNFIRSGPNRACKPR